MQRLLRAIVAAAVALSIGLLSPAIPADARTPRPPATLAAATIDAHLGYMQQTTCSPAAKPGATALLKTLIATWGGSSSGISRHCGVGGISEHKEGRALDWHRDVKYAAQRKQVNKALAWLTANNGEVAYRLGVMYIIWNQRIWSLYYPELGWRKLADRGSYTANHKNHVHISLSWDGAMKQTSWWTGVPRTQPLNSRCGVNGAPACLPTIARTGRARPYQETVVPASFLPTPWRVPGLGGSPQVGRLLTAVPGTWVPADATVGYEWLADGQVIAGATGSTYTVTAAQLDKAISVRVTATTAAGSVAQTSEEMTGTVGARFATTPQPTIAGPSATGLVLTADPGIWSPVADGLSYTWLRNGKAIKGLQANIYQLTAADTGRKVSVRVTATEAGYATTSGTSASVRVARGTFTTQPVPTVTGEPVVGSTLTVDPGAWQPAPGKLSYRWYANGKRISGATRSSLALGGRQLGKQLQVRVKARLAGFTTTYVRSVPVLVTAAA